MVGQVGVLAANRYNVGKKQTAVAGARLGRNPAPRREGRTMQVFCGQALGLEVVEQAKRAEALGYDGVRTPDHYFTARSVSPGAAAKWREHALILMGPAAVVTERVTITQTVMCANFRHPSDLAYAVATLDRLSNGRAELGLGAGWFQPEHDAFGLPWGTPGDRVTRVLEAGRICRDMFENDGAVTFSGKHFTVDNQVRWNPTPHVPEVVVAGARPTLLRGAARVANRVEIIQVMVDGQPSLEGVNARPVERVAQLIEGIRKAAAEVGNSVTLSANLSATILPTEAEAAAHRRQVAGFINCPTEVLERDLLHVHGTQEHLLKTIQALGSLGVGRIAIGATTHETARTNAALDEMLGDLKSVAVAG